MQAIIHNSALRAQPKRKMPDRGIKLPISQGRIDATQKGEAIIARPHPL